MTDGILDVATPFALVDGASLEENLQLMQDLADRYNCTLRPHIKTHKSIEIAKRQLAKGAMGLTTAKISEAVIFVRSGCQDITIAYPATSEKRISELLELAEGQKSVIRLAVDSDYGLKKVLSASKSTRRAIPLYIIVDTGFHRCGVSPNSKTLLKLAEYIEQSPALELFGLLTHGGQAYAATNKDEAATACQEEIKGLIQAGERIKKAGLSDPLLSIGSTPGLLAGVDLSPVDEIRPGNYVFMDRTPLRMGLIDKSDMALSVVATIVSMNEHFWICDAGSKCLSSDGGAHGMTASDGFGLVGSVHSSAPYEKGAVVTKLSEEHGWIARTNTIQLGIGDRIRIFPNHSCVVPNLMGEFYLLEEGSNMLSRYPVDARGCSQ